MIGTRMYNITGYALFVLAGISFGLACGPEWWQIALTIVGVFATIFGLRFRVQARNDG